MRPRWWIIDVDQLKALTWKSVPLLFPVTWLLRPVSQTDELLIYWCSTSIIRLRWKTLKWGHQSLICEELDNGGRVCVSVCMRESVCVRVCVYNNSLLAEHANWNVWWCDFKGASLLLSLPVCSTLMTPPPPLHHLYWQPSFIFFILFLSSSLFKPALPKKRLFPVIPNSFNLVW